MSPNTNNVLKSVPVQMSTASQTSTSPVQSPPTVTKDDLDHAGTIIDPKVTQRLGQMFAHFNPVESIALLIDGPNQHFTTRELGFQIDYLKFQELFRVAGQLKSSYYFSAVSDEDHHAHLKNLITWLTNHGYRTVTKPSKKMSTPLATGSIYKGNMDVEIAVYALEHCKAADHIVLASGDGDFQYLVETLQKTGKKVTVVSSEKCPSCRIAPELRNQADGFIDLDLIKPLITRDNFTSNG